MEFRLTDKLGVPVKNATAILTTRADPHNRLIRQESFKSGENGVIVIDSRREWELVTFMIHGSNYYFWPWCIQAPGYQRIDGEIRAGKVTIENERTSADESEPINLRLENLDSKTNSECFIYPSSASQ